MNISFKEWLEAFDIVDSSKEPIGYDNKPALGIIFVDTQLQQPFDDYVEVMKKVYDANKKSDKGNHSNGALVFDFRYRLPAETRVKDLGYAYHTAFHPKFPIVDKYNYFQHEKINNFIEALRDTAKYLYGLYNEDKLSRYQVQGIYNGNDAKLEKIGTFKMPEQGEDDDDGQDKPTPPSPKMPSNKLDPSFLAA